MTAFIHFTRNARNIDTTSVTINRQAVMPGDHVKILVVIMDTHLRYEQHIAQASLKGLERAMELEGPFSRDSKAFFYIKLTLVVDYAPNIWMHADQGSLVGLINQAQKTGAEAILSTFLTVAAAVAEAKAGSCERGRAALEKTTSGSS